MTYKATLLKHLTMPLRRLIGAARTPLGTSWVVTAAVLLLIAATSSTSGSRIAVPEIMTASADPAELSPKDRELYTMVFTAEEHEQFSQADALMAQVSNRHLVGHVLAQRYLDTHYPTSKAEISRWLAQYSDHPAAMEMAQLALRRGLDVSMPKAIKPLRGNGYAEHLGRSTMPDAWFTALGHWREGDVAAARPIFNQLAANEDLSDWQRAAAYYWSYRAADQAQDQADMQANLAKAAEYPTSFYGLLAAQQLGTVAINPEAPEVSDSLRQDPRAIRAALLSQLGRPEEAEEELRILYGALTATSTRAGIITLASELGLSNLQLRLASTKGLPESAALFASYPTPEYMVDLQHVIDPSLLLAVARNESAFLDSAQSGAGAVGMMQMLPSTAKMVEKRVGASLQVADNGANGESIAARLSKPELSARYGAEYLNMLAKEPAIQSNLIHVLVGYNAGPGAVISWKAAARNVKDPLLYIESIPYPETRNYVMQVSAQYWMYQMMMDEQPTSLAALAKGEWPLVTQTARS